MSNPFARFAFSSAPGGELSCSVSPNVPQTPRALITDRRVDAAPPVSESDKEIKREDSTDSVGTPPPTPQTLPLKRERSVSPPPSRQFDAGSTIPKKARGGAHAEDAEGEGVERRQALLGELLRARKAMETPIDRFGTQACVFSSAGARAQRFQLLVAALLSSQTRDEVTFAAMQRLHAHSNAARADTDALGEGLTVSTALDTSEALLRELLKPVGFYRRKAQHIRRAAATLHAQFAGDVPQSLAELEALPGVGPKIARVVLLLAWGRVDGVIVDTHVHRLAKRFGWTGAAASTPEETRRELEAWLPREHWGGLSRAVVGFGQTVCSANHPKCATCPIAHLCPSAFTVGR